MDICEKLRQVADTKDIDILAKHLVCREAADEIERLRAENFALVAGVCEYRGGNEHGNAMCLKTKQLI